MEEQEQILVLDFGSQYSQLIARRIRECHVYSQVLPFSTPVEKLRALKPRGIILSGGPCSGSSLSWAFRCWAFAMGCS